MPANPRAWRLSTSGASAPIWPRNSREVVFRRREAVTVVAVDPARGQIGAPITLLGRPCGYHIAWDSPRAVTPPAGLSLRLPDPGFGDIRHQGTAFGEHRNDSIRCR